MGSVLLNAAQKEELFVPYAATAYATRFHFMFRYCRRSIDSTVLAALSGMANRRRGNSAQARLSRNGATAAPVFS
jgi:hypothetical protein